MSVERIVTFAVTCNRVGCGQRSPGKRTAFAAQEWAREFGWLVDHNGGDYCAGHMPPTPPPEAPASTTMEE